MKVVVQKCRDASVSVDKRLINKIDFGLMLLVGFTEGDNSEIINKMAKKIVNLRIFEDSNSVMNKSVLDVNGEILSISQFTLYGDVSKGNRPSYIKALSGDKAIKLYEEFNQELSKYIKTYPGKFGADMEVEFTNIGPTTILLEL